MSYLTAKKKYQEEPAKSDGNFPSKKPCNHCYQLTEHEDLMKYGAICKGCFDSYCKRSPDYVFDLDKYRGDPRGWAKRIIDKHNDGTFVNQTTLKFAQEALR